MDLPTTASIGTGALGLVGGGITVGWVAKLLIRNYLTQNDKKHQANLEMINALTRQVSELNASLSAASVTVGQVIALKEQIQNDHDLTIRMETRLEKYQSDLQAQWDRVHGFGRQLEKVQNEIGDFISKVRAGK